MPIDKLWFGSTLHGLGYGGRLGVQSKGKQSSSWYDRVRLGTAAGYGNLGMATWVWLGGRSMGGALGVNSLPAGSVASTARAALAGSHKTEGRGAPATACRGQKLLLAPGQHL